MGRGLRAVAVASWTRIPPWSLLVFGHSHVAALERDAGGGVYANAGRWLDAPTFLRVTPERIELRRWETAQPRVDLSTRLDRPAEEALPARQELLGGSSEETKR